MENDSKIYPEDSNIIIITGKPKEKYFYAVLKKLVLAKKEVIIKARSRYFDVLEEIVETFDKLGIVEIDRKEYSFDDYGQRFNGAEVHLSKDKLQIFVNRTLL